MSRWNVRNRIFLWADEAALRADGFPWLQLGVNLKTQHHMTHSGHWSAGCSQTAQWRTTEVKVWSSLFVSNDPNHRDCDMKTGHLAPNVSAADQELSQKPTVRTWTGRVSRVSVSAGNWTLWIRFSRTSFLCCCLLFTETNDHSDRRVCQQENSLFYWPLTLKTPTMDLNRFYHVMTQIWSGRVKMDLWGKLINIRQINE